MSDLSPPSAIETLLAAVYADGYGPVPPPIVQTSLFTFESYQAFEERMAGLSDSALYSRVQNPTVSAFETMMTKLERGQAAVAFASGMAAISSTLLALLQPGDRVACVEHVYPDTYRLLERILRPFGIETSYHPISAFANDPTLLDGVKLAYLESPTSLMFEAVDLTKVSQNARRHGTLTIIDNSSASPVLQNPLLSGTDVCVHSPPTYISAHSHPFPTASFSHPVIVPRIRDLTLPLLGGKLAPFDAFLLTRGLRTLHARMGRHEATANLFVDRLSMHPNVRAVHSPNANQVPGLRGRSGLLSIEFDERLDVAAFCDALKLFRLGVSWGGFESLVLPARIGLAQAGAHNSLRRFEVPPQLVRISLGLEEPEELWADFARAIEASVT